MLDGNRHGRIPVKRHTSRHHLIHHNTEGIDIALAVHKSVACLLRRRIVHGSHHIGTDRVAACCARDTEICYFYFSFCGNNNILRLDVTVDNALAVRRLDASSHLDGNADCLLKGKLAFFLNICL